MAGRSRFRRGEATALLDERDLAEVVALAEVDAVVAQDRVRGRRVEMEVRQRDVIEIVARLDALALHPLVRARPILAADEVLALERREVGLDRADPRQE